VHELLSSFLFTTWGVCILAALDSSLIFFLPFAVDLGVVFIAASNPEFYWLYAILFSVMSLLGATTTFYIGNRLGEAGLERFIAKHKLKQVLTRTRKKGAIAIAALDLIPPPFPFTAFILAAGALEVSAPRFFLAMFAFRLLRFGAEAFLASILGTRVVIPLIESPAVRTTAEILTVVIIGGSAISIYRFTRRLRRRPSGSRSEAA
jgi:membrane protein YqaA with SNARE-associated domain